MRLKYPNLGWFVNFVVIALCACANPVAQTYQKGIDGGEKPLTKQGSLSKP
jgi:hypothetical protein